MGKKNKYKKDENEGKAAPAAAPAAAAAPSPAASQGASTSSGGQQPRVTPAAQPQQQRGPPPQQQQQRGPPQQGQQQRGPPQQGQQGQWQQRGPPQQGQQQRGPPQQGQQQGQWQQRGPPQQGQQQRGPPQQGQQQGQWQQRGPPQQGQQQRGPPQQGQYQQRGPPQQGQQGQYQQRGPPQGQRQGGGAQAPGPVAVFKDAPGSIKRGTLGRPGSVEANYLRLDLSRMPKRAFHYDVTMEPDRPKKFLRHAFSKFAEQHFPGIGMAYDGSKSCYTVQRLPSNGLSQEVEIIDANNRTMRFTVTIKETDNMEVDLGSLETYYKERVFDKPMRAMQCLEVVLASPCQELAVRAGRSFYRRPDQFYDLGDGYEMWLGLYQAAILGDTPFLNVDIAHKSFPSTGLLTDCAARNYRIDLGNSMQNWQRMQMDTFVRGLTITYRPPESFGALPRSYRATGIHTANARNTQFRDQDGKEMTVEAYYTSKGYKLRFPMLNLLDVSSAVRKVYLPMELCSIVAGQPLNRKDQPQQVQKLIRHSVTSTNVRKERIMGMLDYFKHNTNSVVQQFGIQLVPKFIEVPTRLLQSPQIQYFQNQFAQLQRGAWRLEGRTQFLETKQVKDGYKWAIMYQRGSRSFTYNNADHFGREVSDYARRKNVTLQQKPELVEFEDRQVDTTIKDLKTRNFSLVFVVLPGRGASYADFKQSAELRHGVLTQCIKEETILRRLNEQLLVNLLLKVNAKLNGINHKIADASHVSIKNVMFLGADVTHPSPDQKLIPSVVGVAASHDRFGASYNMQYRLQNPKEETILDMETIVTHHLGVYKKNLQQYPEHIIYYRDGVSDGQFPIIKNIELNGIRAACKRVGAKVKLTCIIVVKRHHTRFFPQKQPRDPRDFNNVEPGTVVDRVIVHPNEVQFFMVSHQSIQGTAKPTRYNVIEDDANMNIDDLQKLTHNMCHLFPRCNRAVSYPTPAYLAHLVAYRGRVYLENSRQFGNLVDEYRKRQVNSAFMAGNPMYFV